MNSYKRISHDFKKEFLERIKIEFENDLSMPELKVEKIDPWVYMQVNRIIDSPKLFYIEDETWNLREEYKKVHEELMMVRNSKEFKKGIQIRSLFRLK